MRDTSDAWPPLVLATRQGIGVETFVAILVPSRNLALVTRPWPAGALPAGMTVYPFLAPTGQGVGATSIELADDRSSRLGNVSCQVRVQAGQVGKELSALQQQLLTLAQQEAVLQGAFLGGAAHDQLEIQTLFAGRIATPRLVRGVLTFTLVDGVSADHRDVEVPVGTTVYPGSPLQARGQAVPLIIGTALGLAPLLVAGAANGTLATALPASAVETIDLTETTAAFPTSGTVRIETEDLAYQGRRIGLVLDGSSALQLLQPTRSAPIAHTAGTLVELAPPLTYTYLIGIGLPGLELLAVRDQDGPIASYTFVPDDPTLPSGTAVLLLDAAHEGLSVDVQAIPTPPPPPLLNGGFESGALSPWIALPATTAAVVAQQAQAGQYKLQLQNVETTQVGVYQDVAVEVDKRYSLLLNWRTPLPQTNNDVNNGDFTQPTLSAWQITTTTSVPGAQVTTTYNPGAGSDAGTVAFTIPVWAAVQSQGSPPVAYGVTEYASYHIEMRQGGTTPPLTLTPGAVTTLDVRVKAYIVASSGESITGTLSSGGSPSGGGSLGYSPLVTILPPLSEVTMSVIVSAIADPTERYAWYLQPDQAATTLGRIAEFAMAGASRTFTPLATDYLFVININGRYIGALPPVEVLSAVVATAPVAPETPPEEVILQGTAVVELGTPTNVTRYTTRSLSGPSTWQQVVLSFVAAEPTVRIRLLGQAAVGPVVVEYDGLRFLPPGRNPVLVMAAVFAQFLPHLSLDQASVQAAAARRDDWLFNGYIPEPGRTDTLLVKMSQECWCTVFKDVDGVYRITADDPDLLPVLSLDALRDVYRDSLDIQWLPMEQVYTDFYVWYQRVTTQVTSAKAGQYGAVLYVTPEASISQYPELITICSQAQTSVGTRRRFDFYCDFIADPQTADLLLSRLVRQLGVVRQDVTLQATLPAVPLALTDHVSVRAPLFGQRPFVGEVRRSALQITPQPPGLAVRLTLRSAGALRGVWETWEYPLGPGAVRIAEDWEPGWLAPFEYTLSPPVTTYWVAPFEPTP